MLFIVTVFSLTEVLAGGACQTARSKGETSVKAKKITFKSNIALRKDHQL